MGGMNEIPFQVGGGEMDEVSCRGGEKLRCEVQRGIGGGIVKRMLNVDEMAKMIIMRREISLKRKRKTKARTRDIMKVRLRAKHRAQDDG